MSWPLIHSPSVSRTGLGRRPRPDKHRQLDDYGGQGEVGVGRGAGKLQTDVIRATLTGPHRSTARLCPAPTVPLPRNDMEATSEVASLTSCHSHPFQSCRLPGSSLLLAKTPYNTCLSRKQCQDCQPDFNLIPRALISSNDFLLRRDSDTGTVLDQQPGKGCELEAAPRSTGRPLHHKEHQDLLKLGHRVFRLGPSHRGHHWRPWPIHLGQVTLASFVSTSAFVTVNE